jgi:tRNA nucleotidyltransferase/poly(A) polymerase
VEISPLAIEIINRLHTNGYHAYLVGGCVRDRLLGIPPKDYDVATDARPDQILNQFPSAQRVGAHFGVVLVHNARGEQVEVATFRSDHTYSDGRRPDTVEFETDPRQDALRRDFTINSLFEDPVSGEVLDFTGGQADLSHRTIRAIGDPKRRFEEDHLRLLRAVRFAARLGFAIAPETMLAIRTLAPAVRKVSPERVRSELIRILTEGSPRRGLELLDESGLLGEILPEVKKLQGVEQPPEYHPEGDVWTHTLMMLDSLHQPSATLAMGVLLHDIGKPDTFRISGRIRFDGHVEAGLGIAEGILRRLRFSREDCDQILALIANHMRFKDVHQMRQSTLKRFLRLPRFDEHLELNRVDCLCSNGHLETWAFMQAKHESLASDEIRPARLLSGRDLIAEGYSPGPAFGRAMEEIETAQLEGNITTKEEALALARQVLTGPSSPNA